MCHVLPEEESLVSLVQSWRESDYSNVEGVCSKHVAPVVMHCVPVRSDGEVPVDTLIRIGHTVMIGARVRLSHGIWWRICHENKNHARPCDYRDTGIQ